MPMNCGVGENSWESLRLQEIQPVHPKGNQYWIFIVRTDAEAEAPTLWPPDVKNWLIGKDPDVRKDWGQEEKGITHTHFWTVLEKTLESPLDCKEFTPVNSWLFTGSTDAEAEAPILWPYNAKSQLIEKDSDAGKDWGQEKGAAKDEMIRDNITDSVDVNLSKLSEILEDRCAAVHGVTKSQTWLSNWTTTITDEHRCKNP